jgi:hypothetical protein
VSINKKTLAKLIVFKCGTQEEVAEFAAEEMISDDFPKNHVRTMGQAIAYLDYIAKFERHPSRI